MKKLIILAFMLILATIANSQPKSILSIPQRNTIETNTNIIIVKAVIPTQWTTTQKTQSTQRVNNRPTGAVIGAGAGWLLFGGPIAIIGGAIAGATMSDDPHSETNTSYKNFTHTGYIIQLSNGVSLRTEQYYKVGQRIDIRSIKQA